MKLGQSARKYLGHKFRHRGRRPGAMDCAGLVVLAYKDLGITLEDFTKYGREPHKNGLEKRAAMAMGEPVNVAPVHLKDLEPDDVVVMRYEVEPHHLAIVTRHPLGHLAIIHADGEYGYVLEQGLSADMADRITHVFRRPV